MDLSLEEIIQKSFPLIGIKPLLSSCGDKSDVYKSLDEIIEERNIINPGARYSEPEDKEGTETVKAPSKRKRERDDEVLECQGEGEERKIMRKKIANEAGTIIRPSEQLNHLSKKGISYFFEVKRQQDVMNKERYYWVASYYTDYVEATCSAKRKELAKEAAAHHLLLKCSQVYSHFKFVKCWIPNACFINPIILKILENYCEENNLAAPTYKPVYTSSSMIDYACSVTVDGNVFEGHSYNYDMAKLEAATEAYETVSMKKVARHKYIVLPSTVHSIVLDNSAGTRGSMSSSEFTQHVYLQNLKAKVEAKEEFSDDEDFSTDRLIFSEREKLKGLFSLN